MKAGRTYPMPPRCETQNSKQYYKPKSSKRKRREEKRFKNSFINYTKSTWLMNAEQREAKRNRAEREKDLNYLMAGAVEA